MDCNKIIDMFILSIYYVVMVDKPTSRPLTDSRQQANLIILGLLNLKARYM